MTTGIKQPTIAFAATLAAFAVVLGLAMTPATARADAVLDKLYQEAKAEGGKVSMITAPSVTLRKEITDAFTKRFPGIELEILGMQVNEVVTKIRAEERAGVNSVDVILNGSTAATLYLKPAKLLRSLDPVIVSAEARDPTKWMDGGIDWVDSDKMAIAMMVIALSNIFYNNDLVKPGEITSDKDLLDPKWKGKIAMNNPNLPGPTYVVFRHYYDIHGPDYIKALMNQNPVIVNDHRQLVDWVAKGTYSIAVGYSPTVVNAMVAQGINNLGLDNNSTWKDTLLLSPGFGSMMMPAKVPHPKAAQLMVNWLLTQEGQTPITKGMGYASRRLDVSQDPVPQYLRPVAGKHYVRGYTEEWIHSPNEPKLKELMKELKVGVR